MNKKLILTFLASITLVYNPAIYAQEQLQFAPQKLADGGYVVYFRHAKRDKVPSSTKFWEIDSHNSCEPGGSLNSQGRNESRNIKAKMETLAVPAGEVYSSPTCRTKQMKE